MQRQDQNSATPPGILTSMSSSINLIFVSIPGLKLVLTTKCTICQEWGNWQNGNTVSLLAGNSRGFWFCWSWRKWVRELSLLMRQQHSRAISCTGRSSQQQAREAPVATWPRPWEGICPVRQTRAALSCEFRHWHTHISWAELECPWIFAGSSDLSQRQASGLNDNSLQSVIIWPAKWPRATCRGGGLSVTRRGLLTTDWPLGTSTL